MTDSRCALSMQHMERWTRPDGVDMWVHKRGDCLGEHCVIHNPLSTHMDGWRLHWRDDRAIFERICPHGVGHPDPSQGDYWRLTGEEWQWVHGCDGCCGKDAAIGG